jgi:hypothetical protein
VLENLPCSGTLSKFFALSTTSEPEASMQSTKNLLLVAFILASLFALAASFVVPAFINALFTPPVSFGTNCEPAADWAMMKLRSALFVSFGLGAILGIVAYFFATKKKKSTTKAE